MLDDSGESTWIDCQVTSDSLTAMISVEREDEDRSMNFSDRSLHRQSHSRHRIVLVMRSLIVLFPGALYRVTSAFKSPHDFGDFDFE